MSEVMVWDFLVASCELGHKAFHLLRRDAMMSEQACVVKHDHHKINEFCSCEFEALKCKTLESFARNASNTLRIH